MVDHDTWYKNQLQEYAQKASMGLPKYKTTSEGPPHAPQFRSVVTIDGNCFTTPQTFSNRKMAEQEAAKLGYIGIKEKVKNEASSRIRADTIFCKSIISEYAVKMDVEPPTYITKESKAMLPVFVSTLVLNGVAYVGDAGKNKKEAEQLAARSAIISILDSETGTAMSEIIRSKFKLFDAIKNGKDSCNMQSANMPAGANTSDDGGALVTVNKRKEVSNSGDTVTCNFLPIPLSCMLGLLPAIQPPLVQADVEQHSIAQAEHQPIHEFKRLKPQTSSATIDPPIVFVPPAAEQAPGCSAAARRRKRKKERKTAQLQSSLPEAVIPPKQVTPHNSAPEQSTAQ